MTRITLEIPEELAEQLTSNRDRLPRLLSIALQMLPANVPFIMPDARQRNSAFDEMLDFLASGPTRDDIAAFKISSATQSRLEELLDKNREEGLTDAEAAELDVFQTVNHILILLKARARAVAAFPN